MCLIMMVRKPADVFVPIIWRGAHRRGEEADRRHGPFHHPPSRGAYHSAHPVQEPERDLHLVRYTFDRIPVLAVRDLIVRSAHVPLFVPFVAVRLVVRRATPVSILVKYRGASDVPRVFVVRHVGRRPSAPLVFTRRADVSVVVSVPAGRPAVPPDGRALSISRAAVSPTKELSMSVPHRYI